MVDPAHDIMTVWITNIVLFTSPLDLPVIGRKVNMAARLMMHYPNKVSCDPETYHHSKLPRSFFRQLPHREMKGVRQAGVIHEYTEDEK